MIEAFSTVSRFAFGALITFALAGGGACSGSRDSHRRPDASVPATPVTPSDAGHPSKPDADPGCDRYDACGFCNANPEGACEGLSTGVYFHDVSVGSFHSCGVRAEDGAVLCWGVDDGEEHDYGQARPPVGTAFRSVSAGRFHTCGIRATDGQVECWGINDGSRYDYGQARPPASVAFASISAGTFHTCGVREADREVACWGAGAISDYSADPSKDWTLENERKQSRPPRGIKMSMVSSGALHTCGVVEGTHQAVCWGAGAEDHFQNASATKAPAGEFTSLSAGAKHTCGLTVEGKVVCWGDVRAPTQGTFRGITSGDGFSCGLRVEDQEISCWGTAKYHEASPPVGIAFNGLAAAAFANHVCGLRSDGQVQCWGVTASDNEGGDRVFQSYRLRCGLLENGEVYCPSPDLHPPLGVRFLSLAGAGLCGIRAADHQIQCWGGVNDSWIPAGVAITKLRMSDSGRPTCWIVEADGSLGCSNMKFGAPPQGVAFKDVAIAGEFACALGAIDGTVQCWGAFDYCGGDLPEGVSFTRIEAEYSDVCAVRADDGKLECGGCLHALHGETFSDFSFALDGGCGIRASDGQTVCWGEDTWGNTVDDRACRLLPPKGVKFSSLVAGGASALCGVRKADGSVRCWGDSPPEVEAPAFDKRFYGQTLPPKSDVVEQSPQGGPQP